MELDCLDRKTRKLMTIYYALHPHSDVNRLYLPRKVKQTKGQYRKTTMQIRADSWHNKALHGQFPEKIKGK
ncbi:hypothetical protein JRQ81_018950, partial [Phrynocephalus forsythii]